MKNIAVLLKIILPILFFICLADMPYGYYELVRVVALIGFALLAYLAKQESKQIEVIVYIGLALLFQPFLKVALGRNIWNIVDVLVGTGLLLSLLREYKKKE